MLLRELLLGIQSTSLARYLRQPGCNRHEDCHRFRNEDKSLCLQDAEYPLKRVLGNWHSVITTLCRHESTCEMDTRRDSGHKAPENVIAQFLLAHSPTFAELTELRAKVSSGFPCTEVHSMLSKG